MTYMIEALKDYQKHVGPFRLIAGWLEEGESHLAQVIDALGEESAALIVTARHEKPPPNLDGFYTEDGGFLTMTLSEAVGEVQGVLSTEQVEDLYQRSGGAFAEFQRLLLQADSVGLAPPVSDISGKWDSRIPAASVIEGLINREMWTTAFEYSCHHRRDRVPEIIDAVGNQFFKLGGHEYFLGRLLGLPRSLQEHPQIAYWSFAAASAVGRQWMLVPAMNRVLAKHEAPELRAVVAMARPGPHMVAETTRALSAAQKPITMRAHGFALGMEGKRDMPLVMFREAMRMAEAEGAHHLAIACGLDIAHLELLRGNYEMAKYWGQWALTELAGRNVSDDMRRLSAIAAIAYATLLAGSLEDARKLLAGLNPTSEQVLVPGIEALVSTVGDVELLSGNFDRAEHMYKLITDCAPVEVLASTMIGLVGLELARGNHEKARDYADYAFSISRSAAEHERAMGELALGMVLSETDTSRAERLLRDALGAFKSLEAAGPLAQTTIWLTIVKLAKKEKEAAMKLLNENALHLQALSDSGWRLLSADHERLPEVKRLYQKSRYSVEISFLGAMVVKLETGPVKLSIKQAELVALIALHPEGLTSEQLHAIQHEGIGSHTRTKVAASRIRKILPVTGSPFRFEVPYRADFIEVTRLVSGGEVQKALNLYSGPLLPESESPAIVEHRHFVEETLRQAVLGSRNSDELIQLGTILDDDLEMWLAARDSLKPGDYRQPAITARIRRIKAGW